MQSYRDKLVEENMKLVYYIFNKLHKTQMTIRYKEDLISEGMLGLVKAANAFDEERKVKFSTFAALCVRNQMLIFIRKLNKHVPHEVSLYQPIGIDSEGSELCLADILEDTECSMDSQISILELTALIKQLKPKEQEILQAVQDGYKQKEIAKMQSLSQGHISRKLRNIRRKIMTTC